MRKVDISKFRKEVVTVIQTNEKSLTSFEHEEDYSVFTFCGENYACEINLNDTQFGFDLSIEVPSGNMKCEYEASADGPDSDEVNSKIYNDLIELIQAIFDRRVSYASTTDHSYIVVEKTNQKYDVLYNQKKRRFWIAYASGWWKDGIEKAEFDELEIESLRILT